LALAIALVSRWVCAAMACAKSAGHSEGTLLKNANGRTLLFYLSNGLRFSQSSLKSLTCPRGKSFLVECQPSVVHVVRSRNCPRPHCHQSSHAREFHPCVLTELCMRFSPHTALLVQSRM